MCDKPTKPLDWDKPLQTTDGRDAVLLTKEFKVSSRFLHLVMIPDSLGQSQVLLYHRDGLGYYSNTPVLRNKTRKVTKWYNLWTHRPGHCYYDTEYEAEYMAKEFEGHVVTLSIEIEEPL